MKNTRNSFFDKHVTGLETITVFQLTVNSLKKMPYLTD
jgi:hypothetical protein